MAEKWEEQSALGSVKVRPWYIDLIVKQRQMSLCSSIILVIWRGNMSEKNIVLIPGDGIGTEIIAAAKAVCDVAFEKAGVKVNWIDKKAGGASIDAYGVPLTEDTIEACKAADAVLLGAVGGPKWDNVDPSIRPEKAILGLRKELGLFCNLRPVKIYPSLQEYSPS